MSDPKQVLTVEWLREQVVALLAGATLQDPPDHQACAKYADLLFKMLPRGSGERQGLGADELERARKAVLQAMSEPPATQKPGKTADPEPR